MITTDISFPADGGHPMRAAYAAPSDSQKHPAVIVIHEIFGLNDDIRRITGKVAELGYGALAPDLYDRDGMRLVCIARTLMTLNRPIKPDTTVRPPAQPPLPLFFFRIADPLTFDPFFRHPSSFLTACLPLTLCLSI